MPLLRPSDRPLAPGATGGAIVAAAGFVSASSNLAMTNGLIWIMIAISTAGSIVTFAFLVYSIWRFRDPKVKGRRYG